MSGRIVNQSVNDALYSYIAGNNTIQTNILNDVSDDISNEFGDIDNGIDIELSSTVLVSLSKILPLFIHNSDEHRC